MVRGGWRLGAARPDIKIWGEGLRLPPEQGGSRYARLPGFGGHTAKPFGKSTSQEYWNADAQCHGGRKTLYLAGGMDPVWSTAPVELHAGRCPGPCAGLRHLHPRPAGAGRSGWRGPGTSRTAVEPSRKMRATQAAACGRQTRGATRLTPGHSPLVVSGGRFAGRNPDFAHSRHLPNWPRRWLSSIRHAAEAILTMTQSAFLRKQALQPGVLWRNILIVK